MIKNLLFIIINMFLIILIIIILLFLFISKKESFEHYPKTNIEHIFFINLEHRKDRLEQITSELKKIDSQVTRINAVNMPSFGIKGCVASHIIALQNAKYHNYKNVLILEDDFEFTVSKEKLETLLTQFFNEIKDWDVLMFAANPRELVDTSVPNFKKVKFALTTSGYLVNNHYYDKLIEVFTESYNNIVPLKENILDVWALDVIWKKLQDKDHWYVFNPTVGKQRTSYSDILKQNVDYNL